MFNINNYGIVTGRLTANPTFFTNQDGSRKVRFCVATANAFKSSDGNRGAKFVQLESYIPAETKASVYDLIGRGDLVSVMYEAQQSHYTDKSGVEHFDTILVSDTVRMQEPKAVTQARHAGEAVPEDDDE